MHFKALFYLIIIVISYSCSSTNAQQKTLKCIDQKIALFKEQAVANPPISVYQYVYKNQLVYYVSAPCCDQYTILYDQNCELICYPSGGFTGKGDGKCTDFFELRTQKKLIWKDDRKP